MLPPSAVACCARRAVILHVARKYATTSAIGASATEATVALKKPKAKRTRKKYADLPAARVLEDGTIVPPLGDWKGGLREPAVAYENTPSSILVETCSSSREAELSTGKKLVCPQDVDSGITLSGKSRKRRVRTLKSDSSETAEIPAATPVRRKHKTLAPEEPRAELPSTPLATEILDNLGKYPHCILLTRVGQFYESYFDQAAEVARLLNIKFTAKKWSDQRIPMCGFPIMHLNKHLKVLVQDHSRFVALCEEFPRDPILGAKAGFDRRVVRIVTPGTLIDEPFLNPYENNYLLSVVEARSKPSMQESSTSSNRSVGLAWIDISTGEFYTKSTTIEALQDEVVRINAKEIVLDQRLRGDESNIVRRTITEEGCFVSYFALPNNPAAGNAAERLSGNDLTARIEASKEILPIMLADEEAGAVELLTAFMHANLLEHMPSLETPKRELSSDRMQIDSHTIKALEIREGMREGGTTGSLLSVIKRTVTTSGTRLLARWLCSPSTSITEINARQSLVALFHTRHFLRQDLVRSLRDAEDAIRTVQKLLLGRGNFLDLTTICTTIDIWSSIKERILMENKMMLEGGHMNEAEWASLEALMGRLSDLDALGNRIRKAITHREAVATIDEDTAMVDEYPSGTVLPVSVRDLRSSLGITEWIIRPEFSEHLTNLHATLQSLLTEKDAFERKLRIVYEAPSLSLRASTAQGMHVHLSRKRDASKLQDDKDFIALSESGSTYTFFHKRWSQLGARISEIALAISVAEKEAFELLRLEVIAHSTELRRNARIIDELDVTLAFANLAHEMRFVRPTLTEETSYHVVDGRHPTVQLGLLTAGREFVPNTVSFTPDARLHIVTGPNMAGKSTLLRQTALIAILAQTGSFVPADAAEIGIVDKVFSRVGAKDDLYRDRSTFMVEMLEASDIMRRATPKSLVIMDEVGRGTTVDDGLAIAFATVHHLLTVNKCRAMFATHFHELADLLNHDTETHKGRDAFSKVAFFCTDVDESENGYFSYAHRVKPGVTRDSHGLKVAQLAGMPESAVDVARSTLAWLKSRSAQHAYDKLELQALGQDLASSR